MISNLFDVMCKCQGNSAIFVPIYFAGVSEKSKIYSVVGRFMKISDTLLEMTLNFPFWCNFKYQGESAIFVPIFLGVLKIDDVF